MYEQTYQFAGHVFAVHSLYEQVHQLCKEYRSDLIPEHTIITKEEDIVYEREKSAREDKKEGIPVRQFSAAYLETLAVYRQIADYLLAYDVFLFHGSAIAVDKEAYLFTAKSGTGKSTHTRLWREMLKERAVMVNDDKPLIHVTDKGATIYGTPWDGKHRLSNPVSIHLKAICILKRDHYNHIEPIQKRDAYPMILQQMNRPDNAVLMQKTLKLLDELFSQVDFYVLGCNQELEAAKVSYEGMAKKKIEKENAKKNERKQTIK